MQIKLDHRSFFRLKKKFLKGGIKNRRLNNRMVRGWSFGMKAESIYVFCIEGVTIATAHRVDEGFEIMIKKNI